MKSIRYALLLQLALLIGIVSSFDLSAQRSVAFNVGDVLCDSTACADFYVRSIGPGERIVDAKLTGDTLFSISPAFSLPAGIPDGDSIPVAICFASPGRGSFRDTLVLTIDTSAASASPDEIVRVVLSARGVSPVVSFAVDTLIITKGQVGSPITRGVMVRNAGEVDAEFDADDLPLPSPLRVVGEFPFAVGAGDSAELLIEFNPEEAGVSRGDLEVDAGCGERAGLHIIALTDMVEFGFGRIPCDSVLCDTLFIPAVGANDAIVNLWLRDSANFVIPDPLSLPTFIPAGDSIAIPICFRPERRGKVSDSVWVVVNRDGELHTIAHRLTGVGIGPFIDIDPIVLNFPKTNQPLTAQLPMTVRNDGERPLTLTAADLTVPAPFLLITPLPITIDPGEEVQLIVEFAPTEEGVFSEQIDIQVGCNRVLQIGLNGATDFIGTGGVFRLSKVGFNPANDERIACDVAQCTDVTLTNAGNASLRVDSVRWTNGSLGFNFTTNPATPLFIEPNQTRTYEVCLNGSQAGLLRDTLLLYSNDRTSIAFGIVLDISGSMRDEIDCGTPVRKLDEAKRQAETFIDNTLLHLPAVNIQDQVAVLGYNTNNIPLYPLTNVTTTTRAAARAQVTGIATPSTSAQTYTGKALREMFRTLSQSPLQDRVVVLLTDGKPSSADVTANPVNTILREANEQGIRIFVIGFDVESVPEAIRYVNDLANGTNGVAFSASDCGSLGDAFAQITELVSEGSVWREPFQITVTAPQLQIEPIRFDSLYVYREDTCLTMTLTNVGEGDAVVTTVDFTDMLGMPTGEFFLGANEFPMIVPENSQKKVEVCFRPQGLRQRRGLAIARYNDCSVLPSSGALTGTGYAIANLRVSDERVALPGETISMPIYGDTALAGYEVDTIVWSVRWNKTMLELKGVRAGAQANGATFLQTGPVIEDGRYASVEILASGPALTASGELALIDFLMLRGDSLGTLVEITSGRFEDNNPKTVIANAGNVVYDSTCFRELKPVRWKEAAAKVSIGAVTPTPASEGTVGIDIVSSSVVVVTVDLFDAEGRQAVTAKTHQLSSGASHIGVDVSALPSGPYWLRITTEDGESLYERVLIAR